MIRTLLLAFLALSTGCAASPPHPVQGKGTIWGEVRLVPPEGVDPDRKTEGGYAGLRLRDVAFVDYDRPEFAVVYLDQIPNPSGMARLTIRRSRFGLRLDPERVAVGLGGSIVIVNETDERAVVSCPSANIVQQLEPRSELPIPALNPGLQKVFVLDSQGTEASIFVSTGPYTVISERGRFELPDISPGASTLHVWHPRFPSQTRRITIAPDAIQRIDVEMRIDN